jgi:hypothetical protein
MRGDIFDHFAWHSSIGIDASLDGSKRFVTRLPNTSRERAAFVSVAGGDNMLIHRTTRALWRVSDDSSCLEPVFPTDILTEDDVSDLLEGEQ